MSVLAVPEFQGALAELATRLGIGVERLLSRLDRLSVVDQFRFVTEAYPELVHPFLAASNDLTVQWYTEQPTTSDYVPSGAPLLDPERLAANARWAVATQIEDGVVKALQGAATRAVFDQSRITVGDNVKAERGAKWARHASANACSFCRVMAIREAEYRTETTASFRAHDHCHCLAVMVRPGQSYEPAPYVAQWDRDYQAARADGATALNDVVNHMTRATN